MDLTSIDVHEVRIPFRFGYGHAKAKHTGVQSIICIARDSEGREGYGEAVPRSYVTGETTGTVQETLPSLINHLAPGDITFGEFQNRLNSIENEIYTQTVPGCAMCALDLAITDLVARQQRKSISGLLQTKSAIPPCDQLVYTASIGISSRSKLVPLLLLYKSMGIRHFKVKVGNEFDIKRLKLIRQILGPDVTLFADANGAWHKDTAIARIEELSDFDVWAIEEPLHITKSDRLTDQHLADSAWIQERSAIPLIADESLISLRSAQKIVESSAFRIFNIRLSKCGGYARANQFAETARAANLSFSLGAMVGESPILATAGAIRGSCHPDHLYIQGHSHRVLHGASFVEGCAPLRRGGVFNPPRGNGSGLTLDYKKLKAITVNHTTISIK